MCFSSSGLKVLAISLLILNVFALLHALSVSPTAGSQSLSFNSTNTTDSVTASQPINVTGTFKGVWHAYVHNQGVYDAGFVGKEAGTVFIQLEDEKSSNQDIEHVQGRLLLRNGKSVASHDVMMKLDGVYVRKSGRLHAVLEPIFPIQVDTNSEDKVTDEYRHSLRTAAHNFLDFHYAPINPENTTNITALITNSTTQNATALTPTPAPLSSSSPMTNISLHLHKTCSFYVDLHAVNTSSPGGGAGSEQLLVRSSWFGSRQKAAGLLAHRQPHSSLLAFSPNESAFVDFEELSQKLQAKENVTSKKVPKWHDSTGVGAAGGDIILTGSLYSPNCNVTLLINTTEIHLDEVYSKALRYSLAKTLLTCAQIGLMTKQIQHTSGGTAAGRLSILTFCYMAMQDAYLCLVHLSTALIIDPVFAAFASTAFLEFILFAIFEMRYVMVMWRARFPDSMNTQEGARRELGLVYGRFYAAVIAGGVLVYWIQDNLPLLLVFLYSFWIPQIFYSAFSDTKPPVDVQFLVGNAVMRLALPMYVLGCPRNILQIAPQPYTLVALVAYQFVQVGVLLVQMHFGPRCFIPKFLLPKKYDYFRPPSARELKLLDDVDETLHAEHDVETGHGSKDCVICMGPIPITGGMLADRMITPCGHFFHAQCLTRWMDIKMECPTCRRVLPPI